MLDTEEEIRKLKGQQKISRLEHRKKMKKYQKSTRDTQPMYLIPVQLEFQSGGKKRMMQKCMRIFPYRQPIIPESLIKSFVLSLLIYVIKQQQPTCGLVAYSVPVSHCFNCYHFTFKLIIPPPIYSLNYFGSSGHFIIPCEFWFQLVEFQDKKTFYQDKLTLWISSGRTDINNESSHP